MLERRLGLSLSAPMPQSKPRSSSRFGNSLHRLFEIISAAVRLKCPKCKTGSLFLGLFKMHSECPHCHFKFEREHGFFVGAIYLNYAATVVIAMPGYFVLDYFTQITLTQQLVLWISFATLFPIFFFRYSRSLWLGLDYIFNPAEDT